MNEINKIRVAINYTSMGISVQCTGGLKFSKPTQIWFEYIPQILAPKISVLRVSGAGVDIEGVGRQVITNVFYIAITTSEWTQLIKEEDHGNTTRSVNEGGYQRSNC